MTRTGVVLMTYGSPRDLDDVARYITSVRGGREPSEDLLVEFRRRYARIGMSPLIEITQQQAAGARATPGQRLPRSRGDALFGAERRQRGRQPGRPTSSASWASFCRRSIRPR